jgi:hypothetical protein
MPITVSCPSCAQQCAVADEHAGLQVRCPKCNNVISVPGLATATPISAAPDQVAPPPPPYPQNPGAGLGAILNSFFQAVSLDPLGRILFYVGAGSLLLLVLASLLPWVSLPFVGSVLGIRIWTGIVQFLLSGAALGFLAFVVFANQAKLWDIALWIASAWAAVAALWRLVNVIQISSLLGFGLLLSLLAALGAAGTLGFIVVQRLMKKK